MRGGGRGGFGGRGGGGGFRGGARGGGGRGFGGGRGGGGFGGRGGGGFRGRGRSWLYFACVLMLLQKWESSMAWIYPTGFEIYSTSKNHIRSLQVIIISSLICKNHIYWWNYWMMWEILVGNLCHSG